MIARPGHTLVVHVDHDVDHEALRVELVEVLKRARRPHDGGVAVKALTPEAPACTCVVPAEVEAVRDRVLGKLQGLCDAARIRLMSAVKRLDRFDTESETVIADLDGAAKSASAAAWHYREKLQGSGVTPTHDEKTDQHHLNQAAKQANHAATWSVETRICARVHLEREHSVARADVHHLTMAMSEVVRMRCHSRLVEFERDVLPWAPGYATRSAGHDVHDGSAPPASAPSMNGGGR